MTTELGVESVELSDAGVTIHWTGWAYQLLYGEVSAGELRVRGVRGGVDAAADFGPGDR